MSAQLDTLIARATDIGLNVPGAVEAYREALVAYANKPGRVFMAFYTPPDSDDEMLISVHATMDGAKAAAERDALDSGRQGWRWGIEGKEHPFSPLDPNAEPQFEDPLLFTDWSGAHGDPDDDTVDPDDQALFSYYAICEWEVRQ